MRLADKFGVSWQIVPTRLGELLGSKNPEKAKRAMQAMMNMTKLDIAALEAAWPSSPELESEAGRRPHRGRSCPLFYVYVHSGKTE